MFGIGVFAYLDVRCSMSESSLTWTFILQNKFALMRSKFRVQSSGVGDSISVLILLEKLQGAGSGRDCVVSLKIDSYPVTRL